MIRLLVVSALVASALADVSHILGRRPFVAPVRAVSVQPVATASNYRPIAILRQSQDSSPDGSYQYSYETENGINAEERAEVRAVGNELEKTAQGAFSWTSPEGEQVSVSYIADGNGYQPQGSHLPVAPPIPPAIQRALEWIAAHPEPESAVYGQRRF
ncbi:larval cuticle protein LCP-17-like [Tribolium madens]|uniref:larval cuticle protein LCP-17-like n=1 Tax=Tribolium madens TaxID=41895 RepID=UPI001CF74080|nr:larval cuticle protein LCP-17-like [Tribolium madens]